MPLRRLPPLHAVRAFEAAARHLSVSRAADELGVTPGAVSRHVRALEAHLGETLFLRRATGLALTASGEGLAEATRLALDQIAAAASGARLRRLRRLSVGVYGLFASRFLLPRWAALRAAQPELGIDLHTSSNPVDLLAERFDAVIAVSDGAPRAGFVTHRLQPIATVPVCAPSWLADGKPDFAAVPLLHARPRPDDWRRWLDHARLGSVPVRGGSGFESIGLAIEAAAAGLGFAIAIEALLGPDLARGGVVVAHRVVRPTRRWFVLQYDQRLAEDPALAAFAAWLEGAARTG
ncbi:MAG: LysR family transcriptional regulator [Rhodospirillales bacterium]|jgi:LysR family glycine cleavage system transcriptional activator|nr:LysR family transcriptional regulator [Rhodospirillales bacterium]